MNNGYYKENKGAMEVESLLLFSLKREWSEMSKPTENLVLCPWICSSISLFMVYGNLNTICILCADDTLGLNPISLPPSSWVSDSQPHAAGGEREKVPGETSERQMGKQAQVEVSRGWGGGTSGFPQPP